MSLKCKYCKRDLPNKNFQTKNGCRWCDNKYHYNLKRKK